MANFLRLVILIPCLLGATGCRASEATEFGPVTFSPDGKFIVFSYSNGDSCFLYKADLASDKATRLTQTKTGCEASPAYSPDGKLIAFSYASKKSGKANIYLIGGDGTNSRHIVVSDADDTYPIFSPSGSKLYFARSLFFGNYDGINPDRKHDWDIFSADISGSNPTQITTGKFYSMSPPSVSPDGKNLIFTTFEQTGSQFELYSASGTQPPTILQPHVPNEPRLADKPSPAFGDVWYMPDGKSVVFLAASQMPQRNYDYDVFRMNLEKRTPEKLTFANEYADAVRPSPDGKVLIFAKWRLNSEGRPSGNELYMIDLHARELKPLKLTGLPE
ncbi:MAG: hypothetical protein WA655_12570 [Candidatus Korobacteraceae bacterium]